MNKALGQMIRGALVLGVVLISTQTGFAQQAGRITTGDGTAISGAIAEVWNNYPGGAILAQDTTDGTGEFSLGAVAGDVIDLRVRKDGYYPTVVRDLPDPTTNTIVELVPLAVLPNWPYTCDFWDTSSTFLSVQTFPGDVVSAKDGDGILSGVTQFMGAPTPEKGAYLMDAYQDDGTTAEDEGFTEGETINFLINGLLATVDGTPAVFHYHGNYQVRLVGTADVPGVTLTAELQRPGKAGESAYIPVTITNTGTVAQDFTVDAEIDAAWPITILPPGGKTFPLHLSPGEQVGMSVRVDIPGGTPDMDVEVRIAVISDTYGSANSGGWTILNVTAQTDAGGNGGGLVPEQFGLAQNYPNPFNASTLITYNLGTAGYVRLDVINLLGQSVRTLVDGDQTQGMHSEAWDGRDNRGATVPSGIYFYRLGQSGQSLVRKMVLLK